MRIFAVSSLVKWVAVAAVLTVAPPAFSEEQMILGPRQFERETGSRGAVLCIWSLYLSMQANAKACNFPREPIDDAVDEAILAIDTFIIANSSLRPTQKMVDDFKRRASEQLATPQSHQDVTKHCEISKESLFRRATPDQIRASTELLLSVPREPVMNPCF